MNVEISGHFVQNSTNILDISKKFLELSRIFLNKSKKLLEISTKFLEISKEFVAFVPGRSVPSLVENHVKHQCDWDREHRGCGQEHWRACRMLLSQEHWKQIVLYSGMALCSHVFKREESYLPLRNVLCYAFFWTSAIGL